MPTRIVHDRAHIGSGDKVVDLRIPSTLGGYPFWVTVEFRHPNNTGTRVVFQSTPERIVANALNEAQRLADRYGADVILVNTPGGVLPDILPGLPKQASAAALGRYSWKRHHADPSHPVA